MSSKAASLDPRKQRALSLLLAGRNYSDIAAELGINRGTLAVWRRDPDFLEALAERQAEVEDEVHHILVSGAVDLALTLRGIGLNRDEDGRVRVQAAKLYFELLGKHKGAPVQASVQEGEDETEEDAVALLQEYPARLLEQALLNKKRQREL